MNGKFTAYTGGLQWSPGRGPELRGNVTRSLRAPSLTELFTPVSPIFTQSRIPAARRTSAAARVRRPARRTARSSSRNTACRRTAPGVECRERRRCRARSQGDTGLRTNPRMPGPRASWCVPLRRRPRDGGGLGRHPRRRRHHQPHGQRSGHGLLRQLRLPEPYCDRFTRNPASAGPTNAGQITFVQTGFANGAYQSMAGVTLEGRYDHELREHRRLRDRRRATTGCAKNCVRPPAS